ncbi:MAG: DUF4328 domain-containing protein [Myxococcales bacterium]|nr:DUF4328 domain-containing protein [Myxococcales bacterium]
MAKAMSAPETQESQYYEHPPFASHSPYRYRALASQRLRLVYAMMFVVGCAMVVLTLELFGFNPGPARDAILIDTDGCWLSWTQYESRGYDIITDALALGFVVTAVMFLKFVSDVAENVRALGARDLRFSVIESWAWFFVPIGRHWRPLQVVRELWRAGTPGDEPFSGSYPSAVVAWWASWCTMWVAVIVDDYVNLTFGAVDVLFALALAALVVSGLAAVRVVTMLDDRLRSAHQAGRPSRVDGG